MRDRPRRVLWIVAIVVAVLVALLAGGWWLRDPLASFVATRGMESQGLSCTRVLVQIPAALPPSPIQLAPMRCESKEGPLQSIEFHAPLYVDLEGLGIGLVHSESVTIAHRAQAHRDVELNTLGDITRIAGFDEPAIEMLFDAAQMSARKIPPFFVSHATVLRAGRLVARLRHACHTDAHRDGDFVARRKGGAGRGARGRLAQDDGLPRPCKRGRSFPIEPAREGYGGAHASAPTERPLRNWRGRERLPHALRTFPSGPLRLKARC